MRAFFAAAFLVASPGLAAPAHRVTIQSDSPAELRVDVTLDPGQLATYTTKVDGLRFLSLDLGEGGTLGRPGEPDVPALHRLVAVDPDRRYQVEVTLAGRVTLDDVNLMPVQEDTLDTGERAPFRLNGAAYAQARELGGRTVELGAPGRLGPATVLPLRLTPIHYNPAKRRLTIWRKVSARIYAEDGGLPRFAPVDAPALTPFQSAQLGALVANAPQVTSALRRGDAPRLVIVTNADLVPKAQRLAALHPERAVEIVTAPVGIEPPALKALLQQSYARGGLDAVILLGDEKRLKLYNWGNNVYGDWYYTLLEGTDSYADVRVGRIPVSDDAEADVVLAKLQRFNELQTRGTVNKNVLLVAHKENYPGKYTANQEKIRTSANPRGLRFTTQYGGASAVNQSALDEIDKGYGIVAYRGHGTETSWMSWGADDQSFDTAQVRRLANADDRLTVFLNIACDTGAIQFDPPAMAEELLFQPRGAVAVLGSTVPSFTEINHKFNEHLFNALENQADLSLGNVLAFANNKLVRDNGGELPPNVKMYVLFGDPLLRPWIE